MAGPAKTPQQEEVWLLRHHCTFAVLQKMFNLFLRAMFPYITVDCGLQWPAIWGEVIFTMLMTISSAQIMSTIVLIDVKQLVWLDAIPDCACKIRWCFRYTTSTTRQTLPLWQRCPRVIVSTIIYSGHHGDSHLCDQRDGDASEICVAWPFLSCSWFCFMELLLFLLQL